MKRRRIGTFILLNILLIVYSFGGIFSKFASNETFFSVKFILYYGILLVSLFVYACGWQQVIKRISLSTAYANKAVTIVWGMIWGFLFFEEQITVKRLIGAIIVIFGVVLFALADRNVNRGMTDNGGEEDE